MGTNASLIRPISAAGMGSARSRAERSRARSVALRALIALGASLVAAGCAKAADIAIYKCDDGRGGVLYADLPCTGGQRLDIRPGNPPDPAALERLARVRDDLDRSAARRRADEQRVAAQRAQLEQFQQQTEEMQHAAAETAGMAPYNDYYGLSGYFPFERARSHRARPMRRLDSRGFAPPPPYIIPRR